MLNRLITRIVDFCTHHAWLVIVSGFILAVLSGVYAVRNFAITTDVAQLIEPSLSWKQREIAFQKAFPERYQSIIVVIDGETPELARRASQQLTDRMRQNPALFQTVQSAGGGPFFDQNGLLFLSPEELEKRLSALNESGILLQRLADDPSLRGIADSIGMIGQGLAGGQVTGEEVAEPFSRLANALEGVLAGKTPNFSWARLFTGEAPSSRELRRIIITQPVLDFAALEPGRKPSEAIRQAARELGFTPDRGVRVRLTGTVPLADEEFATVRENAEVNYTATAFVVLLILWLALRSPKIIVSVAVSILFGFAITAALGLYLVGAYNLISIAFAVLFVGLGVDFGIQFSVRYRAERHEEDNVEAALHSAAIKSGFPLALAATAVAAGFLSFLPTNFLGLSELGLIAGTGMAIAFLTSITILPAMLSLLKPAGESLPMGYKALAPVDRFMERNRRAILIGTAVLSIGGLPLLYYLEFDFNPLNLRSAKVESVSTLFDLMQDRDANPDTIEIIAPSIAAANDIAARVAKLPEVGRVLTLSTFVPAEQDKKLALISETAQSLDLDPAKIKPAPSEAEILSSLRQAAKATEAVQKAEGQVAVDTKRLSVALAKLTAAPKEALARAQTSLVEPLRTVLDQFRQALQAAPVSSETIPTELRNDWLTAQGRARVQIAPSGDTQNNETLRQFARAVLAVAPEATGGPVSILESGRTVVRAFLEAGGWALLSITILLFLALRRITDVALTIVPLLLAGVVTLELCVLFGMKLNYANIIALPLLLGVGVAFKIYYIIAWRRGGTNLLQSSLTRAVFYSALTTATAFGSLWLSSHPGTSSMGKLLALSLACTMAAAVLFQPVLMGPPREKEAGGALPH